MKPSIDRGAQRYPGVLKTTEGPLLKEHQDLFVSRRTLLLMWELILLATINYDGIDVGTESLPFPSERRGKRDNLKWGISERL